MAKINIPGGAPQVSEDIQVNTSEDLKKNRFNQIAEEAVKTVSPVETQAEAIAGSTIPANVQAAAQSQPESVSPVEEIREERQEPSSAEVPSAATVKPVDVAPVSQTNAEASGYAPMPQAQPEPAAAVEEQEVSTEEEMSQEDANELEGAIEVESEQAVEESLPADQGNMQSEDEIEEWIAERIESAHMVDDATKKPAQAGDKIDVKDYMITPPSADSSEEYSYPGMSDRRFIEQAEIQKESEEKRFAKKSITGHTVTATMVSDAEYHTDEVGLAAEDIIAAAIQESSSVPGFIARQLFPNKRDIQARREKAEEIKNKALEGDVQYFIDLSRMNDINVYVEKQPVVGTADQQKYRLRIHNGKGLRMHPLNAKSFNADFDGDQAKLVFDNEMLKGLPTFFKRIIDANGNLAIDTDFFMLGKWKKKEIRQWMETWAFSYLESRDKKLLVSKIEYISNIDEKIDDPLDFKKAHEEAWIDLIKTMDKLSLKYATGNNLNNGMKRDPDLLMRNMFEALYGINNMKSRIRISEQLASAGNSYIAPARQTVVFREEDTLLNDWIDDVVTGNRPLNWQDFVNMFAVFTGYEEGKNIQFRISAAFGKMIKLDEELLIGSEYVIQGIKPLAKVYSACADAAYTQFMSSRVELGEQHFFIGSYIRQRIIDGTMFEDPDGTPELFLPTIGQNINPDADSKWITSKYVEFKNYSLKGNTYSSMDLTKFLKNLVQRMDIWGGMADRANVEVDMDNNIKIGSAKHRGGLIEKSYEEQNASKEQFKRPSKSIEYKARIFSRVYGAYTMDFLFGADPDPRTKEVLEKYGDYTLTEFTRAQHGTMSNWALENYKVGDVPYDSAYKLIVALADLRRKDSNEYDVTMKTALKKAAVRIKEMREILDNKDNVTEFNYADFINITTENLALMNPDVFGYFNMDSPKFWMKSEWGKKILSVADLIEDVKDESQVKRAADILYNYYAMMTMEYRMRGIAAAAKDINTAIDEKAFIGQDASVLESRFDNERSKLKSSSPAWSRIIADQQAGGKLFQNLRQNIIDSEIETDPKKNRDYSEAIENYAGNNNKLHYHYWHMLDRQKYTSLSDVLKDFNIPWSDKSAIIADMIEYQSFYVDVSEFDEHGNRTKKVKGEKMLITSFEVYWQLCHEPDSSWAGNPLVMADGYNNTMENMKEASKAFDKYTKATYDEMIEEVNKAVTNSKNDAISKRLEEIKNDPSSLVSVSHEIYADALTSVLDKFFDDTEKSKQQEIINALFSAVSLFKNGGLFSDLSVVDDFYQGRIAEDRLKKNPMILIRVLADPDLVLTVYNEHGDHELSRKVLLGTGRPTEGDYKAWFKSHPRVAMALRQHHTNPGTDGTCYLAASNKLTEQLLGSENEESPKDKYRRKVYHAMIDHPGFAAVIMSQISVQGRTSRHSKQEMIDKMNDVIDSLIVMSKNPSTANRTKLRAMFKMSKPPKGVEKEEYDNRVERLINHIIKYAEEIESKNLVPKQNITDLFGESTKWGFHLDDMSTYSALDDVEQMLSGAKTAIMTGINGAETRRNGVFSVYAQHVPEPCANTEPMEVPITEFIANVDKYERWQLAGPLAKHFVDRTNLDYIVSKYKKMGKVLLFDPAACENHLHPCENHIVADGSTEKRRANQLTAMSLYMVIQRMDGTEKNNLKVKKVGIDDKDSMTVFSVFDILKGNSSINQWNGLQEEKVKKAFGEEGDLIAARRAYAEALQKASSDMGYNDLVYGQYLNIATMLLHVKDGELVILTAEQIAYVINYGIDVNDMLQCKDAEELVSLMDSKIDEYNSASDNAFDLEETFATVRVSKKMGQRSTERKQSSSPDRTFMKMLDFAIKEHQWKKENMDKIQSGEVEKYKTATTRENMYNQQKSLANDNPATVAMFPWIYGKIEKKKDDEGNFVYDKNGKQKYKVSNPDTRYKYDLFGIISPNRGMSASNTYAISGPSSVWILNPVSRAKDELIKMSTGDIIDAFEKAERFGVNLALTENGLEYVKNIPELKKYTINAVEMPGTNGRKTYMIPMFEMALNGADVTDPCGAFDVGVVTVPSDRFTRMVEDDTNEIGYGDSHCRPTIYFAGRAGARKSGEWRIGVSSLFASWRSDHPAERFGKLEVINENNGLIGLLELSPMEILSLCDLGVKKGHDSYLRIKRDLLNQIKIWQRKEKERISNEVSTLEGVKPGDLVGFVSMQMPNGEMHLAPLRPYQIREGKGSPRTFDISNIRSIDVDQTTQDVVFSWNHKQTLENSIFKFFEGRNPFNKLFSDGKTMEGERKLRSGNSIDVYVGKPSTSSRRGGNLRSDLMYTLVCEARMAPHGYNFAQDLGDKAFPNNPELKELANNPVKFSIWKSILDEDDIIFLQPRTDPAGQKEDMLLNVWLNEQCRHALAIGVNPSWWLTSHFNGWPHNKVFRYDAMFRNNVKYQDILQQWLNLMDPSLCPKSTRPEDQPVKGEKANTLFINDPKTGHLLIEIPHIDPNGNTFYTWGHLFTSLGFVDQHYSGFMKPQVSGSHKSPSAAITGSYSGRNPKGEELRSMIRYSNADRSREAATPSSLMID